MSFFKYLPLTVAAVFVFPFFMRAFMIYTAMQATCDTPQAYPLEIHNDTSARDQFVFPGPPLLTFVTIALNDRPLHTLMALLESLHQVTHQSFQLLILCTPSVSAPVRFLFSRMSNVITMELPASPRHHNYQPAEVRWTDLLSKLALWNMSTLQGQRIVYVDADVLFVSDPWWMFSLAGSFFASRDDDLHDCWTRLDKHLNSGVMILIPDTEVFAALWHTLDTAQHPFTKGDQEIINDYWQKNRSVYWTLDGSDVAMVNFMCRCPRVYDYRGVTALHFATGILDYPQIMFTTIGLGACLQTQIMHWRTLYRQAFLRLAEAISPSEWPMVSPLFIAGEGCIDWIMASR